MLLGCAAYSVVPGTASLRHLVGAAGLRDLFPAFSDTNGALRSEAPPCERSLVTKLAS